MSTRKTIPSAIAETPTPNTDPIRLIGFSVENFGCIRLFELTPTDPLMQITGANGVGKTTLLDAFQYGLRGDKSLPEAPVRKNSEKATVIIKTDRYTIRRTVTAAGTTSLLLTDADGQKVAKPQETLSALWGDMAEDPIAIMELAPKELGRQIAEAAGLTQVLMDLDGKRQAAYEQRTQANRDVTQQRALFDAAANPGEGPMQEEAAQAIINEIAAAEEEGREVQRRKDVLRRATAKRDEFATKVEALRLELAAAESKLAEANAWLAENAATIQAETAPDTTSMRDRLGSIESRNALARQRRHRQEVRARLDAAHEAAKKLDRDIEDVDEEKRLALAQADLPIPGMAFEPDGSVTVDGLPMSKLETSQRIAYGVKIVLARRPRFPIVLIRRGESLDAHSTEVLRDELKAAGAIALVERVMPAADASDGIRIVAGLSE